MMWKWVIIYVVAAGFAIGWNLLNPF